jgi:AraC family carnitine catabolism transcriptional activator
MARTTPYKIGFWLLPEFSHFGLVAAIQPLFLANWRAQRRLFDWTTRSADGAPVRASNGASIPVDAAIGDRDRFDTLLVLACFEPKLHAHDLRLRRALRRAESSGIEIGGIETGSELVAAAGLLDGHAAAVHWDNLAGFKGRYPKVLARPQLYTADRRRLTCGGGTAVIDLMLALVARESSAALSAEVAQQMLSGGPRRPSQHQLVLSPEPPVDALVDSAIALMQSAVEDPLPANEIARRLGVSSRQLRRRFQQTLGMSLIRSYLRIRLSKAHQLLQQTGLPVTEIAISAGFRSLEHFSRAYRGSFGCAPSTDRRQSITAPIDSPLARGMAGKPDSR